MTKYRRKSSSRGLTLIELIVVLIILVGLGGLMFPILTNLSVSSAETTTDANLVAIRDAFIRQWADTRLVPLDNPTTTPRTTAALNTQRFHVNWLFENPANNPTDANDDIVATYDPDSRIGWNGPYLTSHSGRYEIDNDANFTAAYGSANDKAVLDSYTGSPIVLQVNGGAAPFDIRVVSAGPNGVIDIDPSDATDNLVPEGGTESIGDDAYVSFVLR